MKSNVANIELPPAERAFNTLLLSDSDTKALGTIQDAARGGGQALCIVC